MLQEQIQQLKSYFVTKTGGAVAGGLRPSADDTYDLGTPTRKWGTIYAHEFVGPTPGISGTQDRLTYFATATTLASADHLVVGANGLHISPSANTADALSVLGSSGNPVLEVSNDAEHKLTLLPFAANEPIWIEYRDRLRGGSSYLGNITGKDDSAGTSAGRIAIAVNGSGDVNQQHFLASGTYGTFLTPASLTSRLYVGYTAGPGLPVTHKMHVSGDVAAYGATLQPSVDGQALTVLTAVAADVLTLNTSTGAHVLTGYGRIQKASANALLQFAPTTSGSVAVGVTLALSNIDDSGPAWTPPGDDYATVDVSAAPSITDTLFFRFTDLAIPAGATIDGIAFVMTRGRAGSNGDLDIFDDTISVYQNVGNAYIGDDKSRAQNWARLGEGGSYETVTYGSATDAWNASLTPAMLNSGNYGIGVKIRRNDAELGTIKATITYSTAITVYYTPAGTWTIGTRYADGKFAISPGSGLTGAGALTMKYDATAGETILSTSEKLTIEQQLYSSLATGTAPFSVASTTVNTNLNADMVDGQHGPFASAMSGTSGRIPYWDSATTIAASSFLYHDLAGSRLGVGESSPGAKVHIQGAASGIGLIVRLSATTPGDILQGQTSAGVAVAGIDSQGRVYSIGSAGATNVLYSAAGNNTATGTYNLGIGTSALGMLSTGQRNVAVGYQAGSQISTGQYNVAIGYQAYQAGDGGWNMALGAEALKSNTSSYNVAIGVQTLAVSTTAQRNSAIGYLAGARLQTGDDNTLIGYQAGYGLSADRTDVTQNVFIGNYAGRAVDSNTSANVAIGYQTMYNAATSVSGVMLGFRAGYNLSTGDRNIFVGYSAGYRQTTASDLLIFDNRLRADTATEQSNAILYGTMAATPGSQSLRINASVFISGTLDTTGRKVAVAIKSANYTLTLADEEVVFTDSAVAQLPASTGARTHYRIICRSGICTVLPNGSDTIIGETSYELSEGEDLVITDTQAGVWE